MRLHTLLLTLPLACTPLFAQEDAGPPGPAKELSAYDKLIGTFEGTGEVNLGEGIPATRWTATSNNKKVLGGHFVQEDVHIEFQGEMAPPPLAFRNIYGYEGETKKWVSYSISNLGTAEKEQVHWVDGKMMTGGSKTEINTMSGDPQFVVERWSTTFTKDGYTMVGYQTVGNGKPRKHVSGSFKRTKVANASFKPNKIGAMVPAAKQMQPLHKQQGTYRVKGWMIMMPGMPKTEIGATESVEPVFGGSVMEWRLKGDPIPEMEGNYEGYGIMVWSAIDNCYKNFWCDNMGQAALTDAHLKDGKFIICDSTVAMGEPVVRRTILTLNDDGSLKQVDEHNITGTHKPIHSFHGVYKKK